MVRRYGVDIGKITNGIAHISLDYDVREVALRIAHRDGGGDIFVSGTRHRLVDTYAFNSPFFE